MNIMENSEKIKIIQYHNNLLGYNCPCVLRASGKFEVHDESRMPKDEAELDQWKLEMESDITSKQYKGLRKKRYSKDGLTFDYWNEINIELETAKISGDQAQIDIAQAKVTKYITDRNKVREDIPNPND